MISISIAAISKYSAASSRLRLRIASTYVRYCLVSGAMGMSSTFTLALRIRYNNRSSGPSKLSRMTSSASGGIYKSLGIVSMRSPYTLASAGGSSTTSAALGSTPSGKGSGGSMSARTVSMDGLEFREFSCNSGQWLRAHRAWFPAPACGPFHSHRPRYCVLAKDPLHTCVHVHASVLVP